METKFENKIFEEIKRQLHIMWSLFDKWCINSDYWELNTFYNMVGSPCQ